MTQSNIGLISAVLAMLREELLSLLQQLSPRCSGQIIDPILFTVASPA